MPFYFGAIPTYGVLLYAMINSVVIPTSVALTLFSMHMLQTRCVVPLPYVWVQSNAETSVFRKADRFCSPNNTRTVNNLLNKSGFLFTSFVNLCAAFGGSKSQEMYVAHFANLSHLVWQWKGPQMWLHCAHQPRVHIITPTLRYLKSLKYDITNTHRWSQQCPL